MQISDIKQGSIGDRCGVLSVGDKILSINHHILANCSVQDALNILHSSSDTVSLQVEKQFFNDSKYSLFPWQSPHLIKNIPTLLKIPVFFEFSKLSNVFIF